ncbi:gephyrin-like molybdotransferase Glp [Methylomonas sp. AM2-LC]|uniref:molybdopterin molybdotransferase MoeA n=1 Tax=Methylomonas sp. AM2-LC TaxID=3153301 RepID=UPI003263F99C
MTQTLQFNLVACGDDHDPTALPVDQARQRILDTITPLGANATERLDLLNCLDRVLAEDIVATSNVPPHMNSAMDGYALTATDIPINTTRELRVVGSSFAGHPFQEVCGSGECVRIMTGGLVPNGLDTVIPQESVQLLPENYIRIDGRTRSGDNVRLAGEDLQIGQTVLSRGRRITAADLGLIASLGIGEVAVKRYLKVAFFSTGDELCSIDTPLMPGQIYDSNRYTLFGMLSHQHCQIKDFGVVRDDPAQLRSTLLAAADGYDVVIATGGVSVGEADYVRDVLAELGSIAFWKVAMKPGRPLTFGYLRQALFFGLPGNPVAVMVNFSQFVQPALKRLAGEISHPPLMLNAVTTSTLKKRAGRTEYQRGILSQAEDGSLIVTKTGNQGSGILLSMSRANCFIVLNAQQTHIDVGEVVMVQPFVDCL